MNVQMLAKEKKHIKEQLDKAGSYNDMQGILKQYDIYSRQLEEKKQAYEEKLEAVGGLPSAREVSVNMQYADRVLDTYSRLKALELNRTQYDRLRELKEEVADYSHDEIKQQIDNIKRLDTLKSKIQSEISRAMSMRTSTDRTGMITVLIIIMYIENRKIRKAVHIYHQDCWQS